MRKHKKHRFFVGLFFLSQIWGAPVSAETSMSRERLLLCRLGKIVRSIQVKQSFNDPGNQCETIYTKAGIDRQVGKGIHWKSCYEILDNIKGNLEAASWKCRDIKKFKVVTPESGNKVPASIAE